MIDPVAEFNRLIEIRNYLAEQVEAAETDAERRVLGEELGAVNEELVPVFFAVLTSTP